MSERSTSVLEQYDFQVIRSVRGRGAMLCETDKGMLRKQIVELGEDIFPYLIKLQKAEEVERLYKEIKRAGNCLSIKELAVNGRDLAEAGIKPGKELGGILKKLLYLVLEKPECNTREKLLSELENIL